MPDAPSTPKADVLFINGVRDSGQLDVIRATPVGRLQFSTSGSCHVASFLANEPVNVHHFVLDQHPQQEINTAHILKHDLVFCEIADPDSHAIALGKARRLHELLKDRIPWINNPRHVLNTRRDRIPDLLGTIDGVTAPRALRVSPGSVEELREAIEAQGLGLPFILRPAGSHGGQGLIRVNHWSELDRIELARYRPAFVTEYFDYQQDGIYAKYRFAVVDGDPEIRHVIFSNHWIVHSESREFMADNSRYREAESAIVADFETGLKPAISERVALIAEKVGLDYFGIDCAIKANRLILFEVNASMNILNNNQPLPNIWEQPIARLRSRLVERLIQGRLASKP